MKSSLNKILFWANIFLFLNCGKVLAQPIQLVPQKEGESPSSPSLPFQEVQGFWEGTPPAVIESYFSKIPVHLTSSWLRNLRTDVLKEKYTPLLKNPNYEKSLVYLLMETGQLEQAKNVLLETDLPEKEKMLVELQWLEGESKKACEKISNLIRTSPDPEWKMQNIYCLYLNGEGERGKIAAELLSETSPASASLLDALFNSSSHPSFDLSIAKSPFLLSVWCTTGQEIPAETLDGISPSSLALIARAEKMPLKTRLLAAEKAIAEGTFKPDAFLTLLQDSSSENLMEKLAIELSSPRTQILLPLFQKAEREKKLGLMATVFKSLLSKIVPSLETLPLAPYLIRGFLEINEKDLAQKWSTFFTREAPEEAISILPLLHLAFSQTKWSTMQLQAWQAFQMRMYPEKAAQNSYLFRRLLAALGEDPGPAMKGELPPPSWRQEKALFDERTLALLDSAAESKRKGEVLLLILTLIGDIPLKDISPDKFTRLLSVLHKAGYTPEARSLALEFLLVNNT